MSLKKTDENGIFSIKIERTDFDHIALNMVWTMEYAVYTIHGLEKPIVRLHLFIENHTYYQFETHYKSFTAENLSTNDSFPMIYVYVSAQSF